ncbi:MAG: MerR family transcriptional regulator [Burkholderiaceae bacterium]|nr:MerR family transcriptional regulator [Burkholderiaceae bacterium]
MALKVGELARRSGLTVRALHHYDQIGLLVPSCRSEAGYRLYGAADVARLHAIQSLRSLGVPLAQIGALLAGDGSDLPAIVARQLRALEHQMAQTRLLHERLQLIDEVLGRGGQPEVEDWLATLSLMGTYARYFSPAEIRRIVGGWPRVAAQWPALVASLQRALEAGLPVDDAQVQADTQRWMVLMHRWLDGDFELMARWGQAMVREPAVRGATGPRSGLDLVDYVARASQQRMALWQRHFSQAELAGLVPPGEAPLRALQRAVAAAQARGLAPQSATGRRLAGRWLRLLAQGFAGRSAMPAEPPAAAWALAQRLARAYDQEPGLRAGAQLNASVLDFLVQAARGAAAADGGDTGA